MRQETLTEYVKKESVQLSTEERDFLRRTAPSINITPSIGKTDSYDLTPSSFVGAIQLPSLAIQIRPKIPIQCVLFLVSYALDPRSWQNSGFSFGPSSDLVEAIIPGFIRQCDKALERGLLSGYRREERTSITIRGRIRMDEQIKRRFGQAPPVEIAYDEFTEDIEENRLLKAAIHRLGRIRIRSQKSLNQLHRYQTGLNAVSLVEYDSRNLPSISFNRLNERYRPAVELSKLILRSISYELSHGQVAGTAFLVDMNDVFEQFVTIGLREALQLNDKVFPAGNRVTEFYLDREQNVSLEPDISWWERGACVFIGDIKYKRVNIAGIKHPDLYQLLAYVTAARLRSGLLIYAAGEGEPKVHEVVDTGKRLEVATMALDGEPTSILDELEAIADKVRRLRDEATEGYLAVGKIA